MVDYKKGLKLRKMPVGKMYFAAFCTMMYGMHSAP